MPTYTASSIVTQPSHLAPVTLKRPVVVKGARVFIDSKAGAWLEAVG